MVPFYRVLLKLCLQLHKDKGPTMSLLVPGWKVLVLRPGIVLCSWARHCYLTVLIHMRADPTSQTQRWRHRCKPEKTLMNEIPSK